VARQAGPAEDDVMITEEPSEEEVQVKAGGKAQFGYFPRMALANIGTMNTESFCERTLSEGGPVQV
jgi:hypothetical protein